MNDVADAVRRYDAWAARREAAYERMDAMLRAARWSDQGTLLVLVRRAKTALGTCVVRVD